MSEPNEPQPAVMKMNLGPEQEVGVYADFANIWHTPSAFVLDFLALKQPPHPETGPDGTESQVIDAKVAARVRIPAEQIFPLINALNEQSNKWLNETGRSNPPEAFLPGN